MPEEVVIEGEKFWVVDAKQYRPTTGADRSPKFWFNVMIYIAQRSVPEKKRVSISKQLEHTWATIIFDPPNS